MFAPVVLFAWTRPAHTNQVLASLLSCPESSKTDLIVFLDGPRRKSDLAAIDQVHKLVESTSGFKSVSVNRSEINLGLADSVIRGVSMTLARFGRAIILEDDLIVSPHFLTYMNQGLEIYEFDEDVAAVQGYCYPHQGELPPYFFIRGADCWGWATWERAWNHFNPSSGELLELLSSSPDQDLFDFGGSAGQIDLLKRNHDGEVDSWAVRWNASAFLDNMYSLYPSTSHVQNIGMDGTGRHGGLTNRFEVELAESFAPLAHEQIIESRLCRSAFESFFEQNAYAQGSVPSRVLRKTAKFLARAVPSESRHRVMKLLPASLKLRMRA